MFFYYFIKLTKSQMLIYKLKSWVVVALDTKRIVESEICN